MNVRTVYYRGLLRSCNYKCWYCPFSTQSSDLLADEISLNRFCDSISKLSCGDANNGRSSNLTIVFTPYGEALIHKYYHEAIARLCEYDFVKAVACQTNLSFDIKGFAAQVATEKVNLWCSFHPSQVDISDFLLQCELLKEYGIKFCVGAVGNPSNLLLLQQLRNSLPDDIYMWINAMDGLRRKYSDDEIKLLLEIDPLFELEVNNFVAAPKQCSAGRESIFVDGKGDYFACNISKVRLGNLYTGKAFALSNICRAKKCNCYLAYSNRSDVADSFMDAGTIPLRNPSIKKAIFFDVDGTLTDRSGRVPEKNIDAVCKLSEDNLIFLATSLPYRHAKRKCKAIWKHVAGGVFAEGSDIRIFEHGFKKVIALDENVVDILPSTNKYTCYHEDGLLHKITVLSGCVPDCAGFNMVRDGVTGIVSKDADKLSGVLCICKELKLLSVNVTVVGNSDNDVQMLRYFRNSVAVSSAGESAKVAARFVGDIEILNILG